jgi:hypothetical protein
MLVSLVRSGEAVGVGVLHDEARLPERDRQIVPVKNHTCDGQNDAQAAAPDQVQFQKQKPPAFQEDAIGMAFRVRLTSQFWPIAAVVSRLSRPLIFSAVGLFKKRLACGVVIWLTITP